MSSGSLHLTIPPFSPLNTWMSAMWKTYIQWLRLAPKKLIFFNKNKTKLCSACLFFFLLCIINSNNNPLFHSPPVQPPTLSIFPVSRFRMSILIPRWPTVFSFTLKISLNIVVRERFGNFVKIWNRRLFIWWVGGAWRLLLIFFEFQLSPSHQISCLKYVCGSWEIFVLCICGGGWWCSG
jgi:hypothetical protein